MMDRRAFIIHVAGGSILAGAAPFWRAAGEPGEAHWRDDYYSESDPEGQLRGKAFQQAIEKLGWTAGRWTAGQTKSFNMRWRPELLSHQG